VPDRRSWRLGQGREQRVDAYRAMTAWAACAARWFRLINASKKSAWACCNSAGGGPGGSDRSRRRARSAKRRGFIATNLSDTARYSLIRFRIGCVWCPSLGANRQRIAATPSTAAQLRGVQGRNTKAPRLEGGEAGVKRIGAMFLRAEEVAPQPGCEPATHWLTAVDRNRVGGRRT
jgi:hypothetical protein